MKNVPDRGGASRRERAVVGSAPSRGPTFDIERCLLREGNALIAGVDEAGRGSLAGPLCLGVVIYDAAFIESVHGTIPGIDDSKKLTPRRRDEALGYIRSHSLLCSSILVSHRTVDRLNINGATAFALRRLIMGLSLVPDIVIMDGNFSFSLPVPLRSIRGGDARSIAIASASIVAKTRRDAVLNAMAPLFPAYRFDANKGYGTREHIRAIHDSGISPVHRRSYEPVKSLLEGWEG